MVLSRVTRSTCPTPSPRRERLNDGTARDELPGASLTLVPDAAVVTGTVAHFEQGNEADAGCRDPIGRSIHRSWTRPMHTGSPDPPEAAYVVHGEEVARSQTEKVTAEFDGKAVRHAASIRIPQ